MVNKNTNHLVITRRTLVISAFIILGLVGLIIYNSQSQQKGVSIDNVGYSTKSNVLPKLSIPDSINTIWINVGTHLDPLMPPSEENVMVIGFEPNLDLIFNLRKNSLIPKRLHILPCAVGPNDGVMSFHLSKNEAASSSLADFSDHGKTLKSEEVIYVPTIRLDTFLSTIPKRVKVTKIKIDAQGYDLEVIKSSGKYLSNFQEVIGEVVVHDDLAYYVGVDNSQKSWMKFMKENGFQLVSDECNGLSKQAMAAGIRCEESNLTFKKINQK